MIGALAVALVLGADGAAPRLLISRQLLVQQYLPVERETWALRLEASHASLERVSEHALVPAGIVPSRPVAPAKAMALAAAARRAVTWAQTARAQFDGTVVASSAGFTAALGSARLECTWASLPIHAATAHLVPPPKHVECGEGELAWSSTTHPKKQKVAVCSVTGVDVPYWSAALTFLVEPGVEHVTEEDSCLGGEGLRLL